MLPDLKNKMELFILECERKGLKVTVTSVDRTPGEQAALYVQGRYALRVVNLYRKAAGMYLLKTEDENSIVTRTLDSLHLHGRAFDIVLGGRKKHYNLKIDENMSGGPDYQEAAGIGRKIGLKPGYDFGDAPHFQLV